MKRYPFAENLKRIRKKRGLTQMDLAQKIHLTQSTISNYENCTKYPPLNVLYDIARALNVKVSDLTDTGEERK